MNDKRVRSFVLVITFLCSLVAGSHEANRKFARDSPETDQDTVEQVWLNCREELLEITEGYEPSDFYIPQAASSSQSKAESDIGLLKKRAFHKAIIDLPPHLKHTLLKCLNKELSPSQVSGKKSVFVNLYELVFDWLSVHKRYLLGEKHLDKPQQKLGNPPAAPRRAGVSRPPESSRLPTASTAPATPAFAPTTLKGKTDTSPRPSPRRAVTSLDAPQGRIDVLSPTSVSPASLYQFSVASRIQTRQPPAEAPEPTEENKSLAASSRKRRKSPSPSPTEKHKSPRHSSRKKSKSPAPSPSPAEESKAPAPLSRNKSKSPALSPSPSPAEESVSPAPSPSKKSKSPAVSPSPTEKSKSPAPSATKNSESPAVSPSPTEDSKSLDGSPPKNSKSPAPSPLSPEETSSDKPRPKHNVTPPSKRKDNINNSKTKTAVIASCSVAAAILVALSLFCCIRRKRLGPRDGQRDDKPLINVCSGDLSAGSSQAPHGTGSSSKTDNSSNGSNLHIGSGNPVAESRSSGVVKGASGDGIGNLPLPPGKEPPPAPAPPPPPPPPPPKSPAPKAPPPPKANAPPPPNAGNVPKPVPLGLNSRGRSSKYSAEDSDQKAKLKPFFWDKVLANPDHSMVWHDIKSGSFQFNEEMMESLFGYKPPENSKNERKKEPAAFEAPKFIQIIDPRKAQNLSILLRALNVTTEEVCDAIMEGNELPAELIQTLLKMAPTTDEELKLRLYTGDLSLLGPAERFLKTMVDIPFAFKRLESLSFMCTVQEEVSSVKESFAAIEVACNEIKNSRVFLKLLEAVLKTGNRMNANTFRGDAQAFKLDTLLKLSDVKGTDGKTTLLHFVVLEIIRSEGIRAARKARRTQSLTGVRTEDILENSKKETAEYVRSLGLEVVSNLSKEFENVKKAAVVDGDVLTSTVVKLGHSLKKSKEFLNNEMSSLDEESEFRETLASFVQQAEDDIIWLLEEEKKITSMVKSTADYFHGTSGKDEGLRLFVIVRDFLVMVGKVCNEVKRSTTSAPAKITTKSTSNASSSSGESHQPPSPKFQQRLFPAIKEHRQDYSSSSSSSDDDS